MKVPKNYELCIMICCKLTFDLKRINSLHIQKLTLLQTHISKFP
jgi:hypothetical protein